MPKYGLISKRDIETLELTMLHVLYHFTETNNIYTGEIGVYSGDTSRGINEFITKRGKNNGHTAIDNNADKPVEIPFEGCRLIIGNSNEVYNQINDEHFHLLFIDGNHSFPMTVSDFFCYKDKVKLGGFILFHDTGRHIKQFKDYQKIGSDTDPDMYIKCRKALKKIGLLDDKFDGWKLFLDSADDKDEAGGMTVIRKI